MTEEEWKQEFARRLTRRMEYLGLSKEDLARLSGVSYSNIRGYLRLKDPRLPSVMVIPKLAKALITTSSYLLDFDTK